MFFAKFDKNSAREFLMTAEMALLSPPAYVGYAFIYLYFFHP